MTVIMHKLLHSVSEGAYVMIAIQTSHGSHKGSLYKLFIFIFI